MFRAFDPDGDRLVAVKWFALDLAPERVHQFVAELERLLAVELPHPAIAAPLAVGVVDSRPYLAQQFVSGDSLDVAVRRYGPAPPADALRVSAQVAGALDFAAVVNVFHGALHPRDVLLSADETRLTGLGIAAALEQIGIGAPVRRPYTPPERIAGGEWDRRADIFSLAALMHEMLWGRRASAMGAHAAETLTPLPGGDLDALREVFARALAEQPGERFSTALEFAQALTGAFPGAADSAAPPASLSPARVEPQANAEPRLPLDEPFVPEAAAGLEAESEPEADASGDHGRIHAAERDFYEETDAAAATPAPPDDFALREAERARYEDVESAPVMAAAPPPVAADMPLPDPPIASAAYHAPPPISALERSRSAVWPLILALIVGVALGFAGGYGAGTKDRPGSSVAAPADPPRVPARDSTDGSSSGAAAPPAAASNVPAPAATGAPAPPKAPVSTPDASNTRTPQRETARVPDAPASPSAPRTATAARAAKADAVSSATGRLLVRSTPGGARVFVDGREQGRTPVAVRALSHGSHRVRVARDGYTTEERVVTISASQPAQSMTVPLSPARVEPPAAAPATPGTAGRYVGTLTIESRPSGAKVFVDGKLVGETPIQLAEVRAGEHVVRLERVGYRRWSSLVRVIALEANRITGSLEK